MNTTTTEDSPKIGQQMLNAVIEARYGLQTGEVAKLVYGYDTPHNRAKINDWGACLAGGRNNDYTKPLLIKRIQLGPNLWVFAKLKDEEVAAFALTLDQDGAFTRI